jgi:hypothetical protein
MFVAVFSMENDDKNHIALDIEAATEEMCKNIDTKQDYTTETCKEVIAVADECAINNVSKLSKQNNIQRVIECIANNMPEAKTIGLFCGCTVLWTGLGTVGFLYFKHNN